MITFTYAVSGVPTIITGILFERGTLDAVEQTAAWTVIFLFASAAASSAYLTISESFLSRRAASPSRSFTPSALPSAASQHLLSSGT